MKKSLIALTLATFGFAAQAGMAPASHEEALTAVLTSPKLQRAKAEGRFIDEYELASVQIERIDSEHQKIFLSYEATVSTGVGGCVAYAEVSTIYKPAQKGARGFITGVRVDQIQASCAVPAKK